MFHSMADLNYSTWYVHFIYSSQNYNKFVLDQSKSTLSGSSHCCQRELPKSPYYPDNISPVSLSLSVSMDRYSLISLKVFRHALCLQYINPAYDSWQILSYASTSFSWKKRMTCWRFESWFKALFGWGLTFLINMVCWHRRKSFEVVVCVRTWGDAPHYHGVLVRIWREGLFSVGFRRTASLVWFCKKRSAVRWENRLPFGQKTHHLNELL